VVGVLPDGEHLRRTPKAGDGTPGESGTRLRLAYRAPFAGPGLIDFLARRAVPQVEEVVDGIYRRSLRLPHGAGVGELEPADGYVKARFLLQDTRDRALAIARSRLLLDLDADPQSILEALASDPVIGALVRAVPGRRVPGHVDPHELAMRAVLGQQVSVTGAATLTARIVAEYGERLEHPVGSVSHLFPSAEAMAAADPASLPMPGSRARALVELARALVSGDVVLDPGADWSEARRQLRALRGIGPWTAEYVAMRALRDADAFLPSDLGVRRALERLGRDGRPPAAAALAERWRPYRSYALQHLWGTLALA
jgi:AraC family transcriptional regulator, regulatory protein of adaptative response / DNA-3-methyladenine glycosylase II